MKRLGTLQIIKRPMKLNKAIHLLLEFPRKVSGPWNCDCKSHKRRTRSYVSLFVLTDLDKTQHCAETVISLWCGDGNLVEDVLIMTTLRTWNIWMSLTQRKHHLPCQITKSYQCSICSKVRCDSNLLSSWIVKKWDIMDRNRRVLRYRQQIVPIHQLILDNLAILTNATCIDYYSPLRICLWIKQVVTFLTKVERRLLRHKK